jgi:uncharacterized protein with von Willebrand factor type A (vWA) domain
MVHGEDDLDLARETFYSLYKYEPEILEKYLPDPETGEIDPSIKPSEQIRANILQWLMENESYRDAHLSCVASIVGSASATTMLYQVLLENKQMQEMLMQMRKAASMERRAEANGSGWGSGYGEPGDEQQDSGGGAGEGYKDEAQNIANDVREKLENMKENSLANAMTSQALEDAGDAGESARAAMKAWGWGGRSAGQSADMEAINQLLQNDKLFQQLGEVLGRMEGIASNTIEHVKDSPIGAIAEVDVTRDIIKLFPLERAYMSDKAPQLLRTNKVLSWVNQGLLGWKHKGEGHKSGSFVAMIDGSGSMFHTAGHYGDTGRQATDFTCAVAIALGVARSLTHHMGDKTYSLGVFGDYHDSIAWVRAEDDLSEHVRWAANAPGGGTDFNKALKHAIDEIATLKKHNQEGVDLLFVTDGYANLSNDTVRAWRELQEETNSRMFYVNIGTGDINKEVEEISDATYRVTALNDGQGEGLTMSVVKDILNRRAM